MLIRIIIRDNYYTKNQTGFSGRLRCITLKDNLVYTWLIYE